MASFEKELTDLDYQNKRLEIFSKAAKAFILVLKAQEKLQLSNELLKLSEKLFETVEKRVNAGKDSPLEKTRAFVALANIKILHRETQRNLEYSRKQLASFWRQDKPLFEQAAGNLDNIDQLPTLENLTNRLKLNPEYAQFCITTPYPGTKLYDEAEKWGRLSLDYSKFNIWEPVFIPYGYKDKDQIDKLEKKATFGFYFRPIIVINLLKKLKSWEDIKRYYKGFKMALGFAHSVSEGKPDDPKKESSLVD